METSCSVSMWMKSYGATIQIATLLHGTICFVIFSKMEFRIFPDFSFLALLGVKGKNSLGGESERHCEEKCLI